MFQDFSKVAWYQLGTAEVNDVHLAAKETSVQLSAGTTVSWLFLFKNAESKNIELFENCFHKNWGLRAWSAPPCLFQLTVQPPLFLLSTLTSIDRNINKYSKWEGLPLSPLPSVGGQPQIACWFSRCGFCQPDWHSSSPQWTCTNIPNRAAQETVIQTCSGPPAIHQLIEWHPLECSLWASRWKSLKTLSRFGLSSTLSLTKA